MCKQSGRTPFHFACANIHEEMVYFLADAGADIEAVDLV